MLILILAFILSPRGEIVGGGESSPFHRVRDCIQKFRNYGPISEEERKFLSNDEDLIMIRNLEVTITSRQSGVKAMRYELAMKSLYAKTGDVLLIAKKFNLPPMVVAKQLNIPLTNDILEADLGSSVNMAITKAESQSYEDQVGEKLKDIGLDFYSEKELREKKSLLTPDYLIKDPPVLFRGKEVFWLDAKNYPLYNNRTVIRGLIKQAKKYNEAFGPGAMIFRRVIEEVPIGCMIVEMPL